MTEQRIQETPLFKKLLADAPAIEADLRTFNEMYMRLVQRDDETVGTILRCHLVVEHFLDEYLAAANPGISDLASVRLTFAQKLALADNSRTLFAFIMPALRALNRVRNQLAHRLDAADLEAILQPIQDFVTMWRTAGTYEVPKGLRAVQDFTLIASGFMHGATRTIERHGQPRGKVEHGHLYTSERVDEKRPARERLSDLLHLLAEPGEVLLDGSDEGAPVVWREALADELNSPAGTVQAEEVTAGSQRITPLDEVLKAWCPSDHHYVVRRAEARLEINIEIERADSGIARSQKAHEGTHVYHYAPYEPSAFKRLMGRYATREQELDKLIRAGRFIDLYGVIRQGLRAGIERYSIKNLEVLYGFDRAVPLADANRSLLVMAQALELECPETVPQGVRNEVEGYNKDDCVSTLRLRDWLEKLRGDVEAAGTVIPRPEHKEGEASEKVDERAQRVSA